MIGVTNMKKTASLIISTMCLTGYAASAQTPPPGYMQQQPPPGYAQQPPPGYVQQPPPGYVQQPPIVVAQYCQPYTDSFTMGGEKRITRGTACMHPDGSWELHPTQAAVNYVTRGGAIFIVPSQPFATVVVDNGHPHHHHHDDYGR